MYSTSFAPGLRVNNCPAINVGWDSCPLACFIKPGCPDASHVQMMDGFKGNAWYCVDDSGEPLDLDSSDDEWSPCCLRQGCSQAEWNQQGVWNTFHEKDDEGVRGTWTCSGEGTTTFQSDAKSFCAALTDGRKVEWYADNSEFDAGQVKCEAVHDNSVSLTTDAGQDVTKYFWFQNDDWSYPGAVKLSWGDGKDYWYVTAEEDGSMKVWCASGTLTFGVLFPSEPGSACDGYDSPPQ